jgi:hypothetical protein
MASMTVPTLNPQPNQVTVVVGGVDTHKDLHVAAVVSGDGTLFGTESSPPPAPATGDCCGGCAASATCAGSASRAPVAMAPASPDT